LGVLNEIYMDKNLFKIPGIEIQETVAGPGLAAFWFRNIPENFVTILRWATIDLNEHTFWERIADKINTLLYNRIKFEDKIYLTGDELVSFIEKNFPRYSPQEKLDVVLEYISGLTDYEGQKISINIKDDITDTEIWRRYYFHNQEEFLFYIENLKDQGLISYDSAKGYLNSLRVTLAGLTAILKISEKKRSRYCFVAMSFDRTLDEVYDSAISPALIETGFIPFIVRNENVESEKTINDAIIAGIKKARFTIADFTQHKAGVYFEAGYALGRGQKVIYSCRRDDLERAHFDVRNYQLVVWDNVEDLKQKLTDKISAFILD
jgi:hypothetical protein